jgi:hypothetical protein
VNVITGGHSARWLCWEVGGLDQLQGGPEALQGRSTATAQSHPLTTVVEQATAEARYVAVVECFLLLLLL